MNRMGLFRPFIYYYALALMKLFHASLLLLIFATPSLALAQRNERPVAPLAPASELVSDCKVTVQFNEDEASVPESDYIDSMYCLGLMEGITSTNRIVGSIDPKNALFCPDDPNFKVWHAAKVVVDYAIAHPEHLEMEQSQFAVVALTSAFPCIER